MYKNIAFHRNLYLSWLDAAAALRATTAERAVIRAHLDELVGQQIASPKARDMTLDMLLNIWAKTEDIYPALHQEAVSLFRQTETVTDRVWLHYGLTLLYYDFFRLSVRIIGQLSRYSEHIAPRDVKTRLSAELGQIGALDKAAERVIFSLRNWGILLPTAERSVYAPVHHRLTASCSSIERWLLAAALCANPAQELPFTDLVQLPELFPFCFTVGVDELRKDLRFAVHRQGLGWDMVQLVDARYPVQSPLGNLVV